MIARIWPESTVVCIGGGPSLTPADVDLCRGRAKVIAVNDAYRLCPWADVLYAADYSWWRRHDGVPTFPGLKYSIRPNAAKAWPQPNPWGVTVLRNDGVDGLCRAPDGLRTGKNSGYQAINLAVHLGATRILLLGYDMQARGLQTHWFGDHTPGALPPPFSLFLKFFPTLVTPLRDLGVEVINCTRRTALQTFPRHPLEQALGVVRYAEAV